jgi:hypothetical protein
MSPAKLPVALQHGIEKTLTEPSVLLLTNIALSQLSGKASVIKALSLANMAAAGQCTSKACHPFLKSSFCVN